MWSGSCWKLQPLHSKPQTANYLSQQKHRDALRDRGEAEADFSKTLDLTGSFPPLLSPLKPKRERKGYDRGMPTSNLVTEAALAVVGVAFVHHTGSGALGTGNAAVVWLRGFPFEQKAQGLTSTEIMELLTGSLGLKAVRIPLPTGRKKTTRVEQTRL